MPRHKVRAIVEAWYLGQAGGQAIAEVRRLTLALGLIMLLVWVHTALNLFAIREDLYAAIRTALNYQITIGSAGFAVSNIVAFVLRLVVGSLCGTKFRRHAR
jgi:hypothetical protein